MAIRLFLLTLAVMASFAVVPWAVGKIAIKETDEGANWLFGVIIITTTSFFCFISYLVAQAIGLHFGWLGTTPEKP